MRLLLTFPLPGRFRIPPRLGRHRATAAVLACGILLLGVAPAAVASVIVDLDDDSLLWRNDGDPGIVLQRRAEKRPWRERADLAHPLAAPLQLRFPPCLPGLPEQNGGCPDAGPAAGGAGLELTTPLDPTARRIYESIWQGLPPLPSAEEISLAAAMGQAARDLAGGISFRSSRIAFLPVQQALERAEAAQEKQEEESPLLARARQARDLFAVQRELWQEEILRASRDLTIPCDRLRRFEQRFNRVAGEEVVRLRGEPPRGICLFCGNVCSLRSAERLLGEMNAVIVATLQAQPTP